MNAQTLNRIYQTIPEGYRETWLRRRHEDLASGLGWLRGTIASDFPDLARELGISVGEIDIQRLCGESYPAEAIVGGAPEENAMILRGVLSGGLRGAYRFAAVLNAAAAIWVADKARSLKEGIAVAEESLDSGAAGRKLEAFLGMDGKAPARDILCELAARRRADAAKAERTRSFAAAFRSPGLHVIAELKKASPSKGLIRPQFAPAELAAELEEAGAAALSVLAEPHRFLGSDEAVRAAREASALPILYKDFVTTGYQILRARAAGADAVLLVVAALADGELARLLSQTRSLGMEALVETHSQEEIARAVAAGAEIVGVNARDLRTFRTNPGMVAELLGKIPPGIVKIAESGIASAEDIRALRAAGADGFLVGEALMRAERPGEKLKELTGAADAPTA